MSFDIESLNVNDEPIEGLAEAFDNWQEPPEFPPALKPGKHQAALTTREVKVEDGIINLIADFECKGGDEDGDKLTFERLSSRMFQRRSGNNSSQVLDMIKSSGIEGSPSTVVGLLELIKHIEDTGRLVNFQSDLGTYCTDCASKVLLEMTGEATDEVAKETLRGMDKEPAKKIYDAIRKAAVKHKNYKAIPVDGKTGRHVDSVECPTCNRELRVNARIVRWLSPAGDQATVL